MPRPSKRRRQEMRAGGTTPSNRPPAPVPERYRPRKVTVKRPWWQGPWGIGSLAAAVVAVVVIFIVVAALGSSPASTGPIAPLATAPASVVSAVTGVSNQVSDTIGTGGVSNTLQPVSGTPARLTGPDGKPEVLFVGAEYCPFCAAERWSVVIAFSRFGTFTNLQITMSDSNADDIPDTHTFSFRGATYSSQYLDFVPVETETRTYQNLQSPTAAEQALIDTYDASPYSSQPGGLPFMDLGNQYIVSGSAAVHPQQLQGLTWQQIANDLSVPSSPVAQEIVGDANYLTAGICKLTGDQPSSVCDETTIAALETQLGS
jgi:hypothetical protein